MNFCETKELRVPCTHFGSDPSRNMSDKPKRGPLTAFNLFFKFQHKKIASSNAHLSGSQIVKEISIRWKNLSEKERKPFLEAAATEQKRYRTALVKWKAENKLKKDNDEFCKSRDTVVSGNQLPSSKHNSYNSREDPNSDLLRLLLTTQHDAIKLQHTMVHAIMHASTAYPSSDLRQRSIPTAVPINPTQALEKKCSPNLEFRTPLEHGIPSLCQPKERHAPFHPIYNTSKVDHRNHSIPAQSTTRAFDAGDEAVNPIPLSALALPSHDSPKAFPMSDLALPFHPRRNGYEHEDMTFPCLRHDDDDDDDDDDDERGGTVYGNNSSTPNLTRDQFRELPILDEVFPRFHEVSGVFDCIPDRVLTSVIPQTRIAHSDDPIRIQQSRNVPDYTQPGRPFPMPDLDEMQELLSVFDD